jgi:hypothetical protein
MLISLYVHPALLIVHSQNRPQIITKLEAFKLAVSAIGYGSRAAVRDRGRARGIAGAASWAAWPGSPSSDVVGSG